jgi:D-lactate dehydrogenase
MSNQEAKDKTIADDHKAVDKRSADAHNAADKHADDVRKADGKRKVGLFVFVSTEKSHFLHFAKLQIGVFSSREYDTLFLSAAAVGRGLGFRFFHDQLNTETLAMAAGFEGLCLFVNDALNARDIEYLYTHGMRLILLRCAGFNNVDLEACRKLSVRVMRVPAYSPNAVAEFALASLLCLIRHVHVANARVRSQNFLLQGLLGFNLHGKVIGVLGTGNIGQWFCRIVAGFGVKILAFDAFPSTELAAELSCLRYVSLEQLAVQADVISVHLPLLPETRHIVSAKLLATMKPSCVIVNTSRGGLVDTQALLDALKTKKIAGYAADVYEQESALFYENHESEVLADDAFSVLSHLPNVLMTGHLAFFTQEALEQIALACVENAHAYQSKELSKSDVVSQNKISLL